jgi:hypothetical protein
MGRRAVSTRRVWTEAHLRARQHAPGPSAPPLRPGRKPRPPRNTRQVNVLAQSDQPPAPRVIDDFPQAVPVGAQELEVIETYLGALLNELIGPQK